MIKLRQIAGVVCAMITCWTSAPGSSSMGDPINGLLSFARAETEKIADSIKKKHHNFLYNYLRQIDPPESFIGQIDPPESFIAAMNGKATDEQKIEVAVEFWDLITNPHIDRILEYSRKTQKTQAMQELTKQKNKELERVKESLLTEYSHVIDREEMENKISEVIYGTYPIISNSIGRSDGQFRQILLKWHHVNIQLPFIRKNMTDLAKKTINERIEDDELRRFLFPELNSSSPSDEEGGSDMSIMSLEEKLIMSLEEKLNEQLNFLQTALYLINKKSELFYTSEFEKKSHSSPELNIDYNLSKFLNIENTKNDIEQTIHKLEFLIKCHIRRYREFYNSKFYKLAMVCLFRSKLDNEFGIASNIGSFLACKYTYKELNNPKPILCKNTGDANQSGSKSDTDPSSSASSLATQHTQS